MKGAQDLQSIISLQGYIEAFRTGNDAKRAALEADYNAKRAALNADYSAKRAALNADYSAKSAVLDADHNAKRDALYADYDAKRAALDADYSAKCTELSADYSAKRAALEADYSAKYTELGADYSANRATLDADYNAKYTELSADYSAKRAALAEDLSPDERREIEAEHSGQSFDDGLKFASTPKEIVAVYTNYDEDCSQVADSCMRYECCDFPEGGSPRPPQHPCSVYGAGDLAIAYTVNVAGQTTARALCWPEKKIYSRVYANDGDRLHRLLKKRGFKKSGGYYGADNKHHASTRDADPDAPSLAGARILRIAWRRTAASSSCPTATTLNARRSRTSTTSCSAPA